MRGSVLAAAHSGFIAVSKNLELLRMSNSWMGKRAPFFSDINGDEVEQARPVNNEVKVSWAEVYLKLSAFKIRS
jgi:hypothetical protein